MIEPFGQVRYGILALLLERAMLKRERYKSGTISRYHWQRRLLRLGKGVPLACPHSWYHPL